MLRPSGRTTFVARCGFPTDNGYGLPELMLTIGIIAGTATDLNTLGFSQIVRPGR
jgi:hypothetical protein